MKIPEDIGQAAEMIHKLRVALSLVLEHVELANPRLDIWVLEQAREILKETE